MVSLMGTALPAKWSVMSRIDLYMRVLSEPYPVEIEDVILTISARENLLYPTGVNIARFLAENHHLM